MMNCMAIVVISAPIPRRPYQACIFSNSANDPNRNWALRMLSIASRTALRVLNTASASSHNLQRSLRGVHFRRHLLVPPLRRAMSSEEQAAKDAAASGYLRTHLVYRLKCPFFPKIREFRFSMPACALCQTSVFALSAGQMPQLTRVLQQYLIRSSQSRSPPTSSMKTRALWLFEILILR